MSVEPSSPQPFVSTGHLPADDRVGELVDEAVRCFAPVTEGDVSAVYPALAAADPDRFGVAVRAADGREWVSGDVDVQFPVMSVSKPFVLALVCDLLGVAETIAQVGADATGRSFDSVAAVDASPDGRTNPMVNSGALATTSLALDAAATSGSDPWELLHGGMSRFAGRNLGLDRGVLASALTTNLRNRAIAATLLARGAISGDPEAVVDLYTRQCCLAVTARDLAVMGATLADGGVNPLSGERVVSARAAAATLATMATAGMYETSGTWLVDVGLPGKSGIGGGIVAAAPGKGGLGTFSPRLDAAGNSVRGQLAARFLADELGLDLFASAAAQRRG